MKPGLIMITLASAALAACSARSDRVPVDATPVDMRQLAGEWQGTYETTSGAKRSGTILFNLQEGRDTAVGYVVMTYASPPGPEPVRPAVYPAPPYRQSELLTISFVRATYGRITGELDQYVDPYCGCRLRTAFVGTLKGDVISGVFMSRHLDGGQLTGGTWRATRQHR
jgi:hypothetical protein